MELILLEQPTATVTFAHLHNCEHKVGLGEINFLVNLQLKEGHGLARLLMPLLRHLPWLSEVVSEGLLAELRMVGLAVVLVAEVSFPEDDDEVV